MLETAALEAELDPYAEPAAGQRHQEVLLERREATLQNGANTRVHAGVAKSFLAIHLFMFAVLALTFAGDGETLFMIAICAFYFAMYVGTPYVMACAGGESFDDQSSWSEFLNRPFETWTGHISGREAFLQICLVPLAVTIAIYC